MHNHTAPAAPSTILLVEDEPAVRLVTHEALETGGHQRLEAKPLVRWPVPFPVAATSSKNWSTWEADSVHWATASPFLHSNGMAAKAVKEGKNAGKPAQEYNPRMARGWESKSVEAQVEESFASAAEKRRVLSAEDLQREHKRTELTLSRHHVAEQLEQSTNERYSEMLRRALADLDAQIAKLAA